MRCRLTLMLDRMCNVMFRVRGSMVYEALTMVLSPGNINGKHWNPLGFQ